MENTGLVGDTPVPENNLLCKAYLSNMRIEVTHEENECNGNRNMVVIQLDEKFLTKKKLTLKDADEKKEQLLARNA